MIRSQLSIMGLYDYDDSIFDGFEVPAAMNKETCIAEILMQCAELELVYPSAITMKQAITLWTRAELPQWERAYTDMTIEYNPIWNVDADETETITRELTGTNEIENDNVVKENISNEAETKSESIDSVAGYNSESWTNSTKTSGTSSATGEETRQTTANETGTNNKTETETITTERKRGGNIGVTMTQQMLNADLDLLIRLNPYQYIVDSFKRRFCLLVY